MPSFTGIGKGNLVREIDALDGIMGIIADKSAINFKLLNRSKDSSVRSPRTQVSRNLYKKNMQEHISKLTNCIIKEGIVEVNWTDT